jgi:hypothetical protein
MLNVLITVTVTVVIDENIKQKAQKLVYCNGRPYYVARYAPLP